MNGCLLHRSVSGKRPDALPLFSRIAKAGFTLVELLAALSVLTLLVLLLNQLFLQAAKVTTIGGKQIDAGTQARVFFDRMAIDFSHMVKRPDVDYYFKSPNNQQTGNDRLAFFSEVPGYYTGVTDKNMQSPFSLIAYRWNSTEREIERMGKGLVWNGTAANGSTIVFLPLTIASVWPEATNSASDSSYEVVSTCVLRFEYFYLLKAQPAANLAAIYSDTPWDTRLGHTAINGLADVSTIVVVIAVIDSRGQQMVKDIGKGTELAALASQMRDYDPSMTSSDLEAQWTSVVTTALSAPTPTVPKTVLSGIRFYQRYFPINASP